MLWRIAADALLLLHLAFVVFVLLGGLLAWRWPRMPWLHLPALAWGVLVEVADLGCPLTRWENALRQMAGEVGYRQDFIAHYLTLLLYPPGLGRGLQFALAALALGVNAGVYVCWWRRQQKRPSR